MRVAPARRGIIPSRVAACTLPRMRAYLAAGLIAVVALGFMAGAGHLVYWQHYGKPAIATVTSCSRRGRAITCRGSWMVDWHVTLGEIENTNASDLGKQVEVRVLGERAMQPGLRLPIILFLLGLGVAMAGVYWWKKERVRPSAGAP